MNEHVWDYYNSRLTIFSKLPVSQLPSFKHDKIWCFHVCFGAQNLMYRIFVLGHNNGLIMIVKFTVPPLWCLTKTVITIIQLQLWPLSWKLISVPFLLVLSVHRSHLLKARRTSYGAVCSLRGLSRTRRASAPHR